MIFVKAFVVGGLICVVGQLLMEYTKLKPGQILVLFVVLGAIIEGFGLYQPLIDFAEAGATVPLPGFGALLVRGTVEEINKIGLLGLFTGGVKAAAAGIGGAVLFAYLMAALFKSKSK